MKRKENRKSYCLVDDSNVQQDAAIVERESAGATVPIRQLDGRDSTTLCHHAQRERERQRAAHAKVRDERLRRAVV